MRIIAAIDFSPVSLNAARTAAQLARKLGDSLLLVWVVEPPAAYVYPGLPVPNLMALEDSLTAVSETAMSQAAAGLRDVGVKLETRIIRGFAAEALSELARAEDARVIVMGSHRRGRLGRLVFGSVAERTVLTAPCPVLVVPEGAAPFDAWVEKGGSLRLVVGLDLDAAVDAVVHQVRQLRAVDLTDATFVHAYWPPQEYVRLGLYGSRDLFGNDPELAALIERDIRARVTLPTGEGKTELRIQGDWGMVGDTLAAEALAQRADLVVVGTRQPHGLEWLRNGSGALGTLRRAGTAVLCVPAKAVVYSDGAATPIPTIRTVLVPTDLSDLGNAAIPHAYSLLRGSGGTVELCYVHERHLPFPIQGYPSLEGALGHEERVALEARLRSLVPAEAGAMAVTTSVAVIDGGEVGTALLQAARRLGADAIAISSHGRSGLGRAVMGSVAEQVVRNYEKPVLVVRWPGR